MTTPRTLLLLHFDDAITTARPVDEMGELAPLAPVAPLTMPAVVDAHTGRGRMFRAATLTGLVAQDAADGNTVATRDVTIHAIASIAEGGGVWPRMLLLRGDGSAAAEYCSYGLELHRLYYPASLVTPPTLELRLVWQDAAGGLTTHRGGTFEATPDSAYPLAGPFYYFAASRRWVSSSEVVCRYYVNGQMIAEVTETDGDIGGGTTGHMSIGCRKDAGVYDRHWEGAIDEVRVDNYECSAEEIKANWDRITIHQPNGERAIQALMPPGSNWADISTRWGKLTRIAGQAVGLGLAKIEELRANWLPDRAYQGEIERWEKFLGISPGAADSLDARRDRCVRYLQRDNGYAVAQLQEVLSEPLDLAASDVQILQFSNTITDAFATLEAERWHAVVPAGSGGTWTISAGQLRYTMSGGQFSGWNGTRFDRCHCVTPLTSDGRGPGTGVGRLLVQTKVTSYTGQVPASALTGICLWNFRTRRLLVFGVYNDAGTERLGYRYFDGSTLGAFVQVAAAAPAAPFWLRMAAVHDVAAPYAPTSWKLGYATAAAIGPYTEVTVAAIMADPEHAGFWGCLADAATAGSIDVLFDDAVIVDAGGKRPFNWYAYRNPALAGAPNVELANRMVRSGLRPAHTHGAAIASKSVLCDETDNGLCDRGPMGGL